MRPIVLFAAPLLLSILVSGEASSQQKIDVGAIVEELAEAAAFVKARTALVDAPSFEVPNGGRLVVSQRVFSADLLEIGAGAELLLDVSTASEGRDFFVVARRLVVPTGAEGAKIGWVDSDGPTAPTAVGRAANGRNGTGAGQDGGAGTAGQIGKSGQSGSGAPHLTLVVLEMEGDSLRIDLGGGDGSPGGVGQAGGHGGNGARGTPARTAWVKFLGGKTAAGCAAGPGRGGRGGNAGAGGPGGVGGKGGKGGVFRLVGPSEVAEAFFESGEIDVSPGAPGAGGAGGEAGRPGQGGSEGKLASHCGSAGRQGSSGSPASTGRPGSGGLEVGEGTVGRIDIDPGRLVRAFGFGADDG